MRNSLVNIKFYSFTFEHNRIPVSCCLKRMCSYTLSYITHSILQNYIKKDKTSKRILGFFYIQMKIISFFEKKHIFTSCTVSHFVTVTMPHFSWNQNFYSFIATIQAGMLSFTKRNSQPATHIDFQLSCFVAKRNSQPATDIDFQISYFVDKAQLATRNSH